METTTTESVPGVWETVKYSNWQYRPRWGWFPEYAWPAVNDPPKQGMRWSYEGENDYGPVIEGPFDTFCEMWGWMQ